MSTAAKKRESGNFNFYERKGDVWLCKTCGSVIAASIKYFPVWDGPFPCSGSGEVISENIPFCPTCEERPDSRGTPVTRGLS